MATGMSNVKKEIVYKKMYRDMQPSDDGIE